MTYPCPFCHVPASAATGCSSCGRGPDRDALEVIRLDGVITALNTQLTTARRAAQRIEGELTQAWARRNAAAAKVRSVVAHSAAVRDVPPPTAAPPPGDLPRAEHAVPPSRETSTKWIQNALFLLGGLLLAVAAVVFTAVAWAQFGVGGRAALLAVFTGAALAVPLPAQRRGLTATAETFAAVGLLLIVLDGYAAWYVNLSGVAAWSPWIYSAAVAALTAAVATGYARLTGLTGPRFAALLIAQPVLPLALVPAHPHTVGWAYLWCAVALLDLTVLLLSRHALRFLGAGLAALALVTAGALATAALIAAPTPARAALAGGALILAVLLPLTAATRLHRPTAQAVLAGTLALAVAAPAARVAVLLAPGRPLLPVSLALLAVALLAATARYVWLGRSVVARGVQIGTATALFPAAAAAFAYAAEAAARTLDTARPLLHAPLTATVPGATPSLPLAIALLALAFAATLDSSQPHHPPHLPHPRHWVGASRPAGYDESSELSTGAATVDPGHLPHPRHWVGASRPAGYDKNPELSTAAATFGSGRRLTVYFATALALLTLPAAFALPWWTAPIFDLLGVAAALFLTVRDQVRYWVPLTIVATALTAHGLAAAFGTAGVAAGALAAVSALGLGLSVLAQRTLRHPVSDAAGLTAPRLGLAGSGLFVGLLTWPAVAWATTAALTSSPPIQSRVALAAALLPTVAVHLIGRRLGDLRPFALAAALIPAVIAPFWGYAAGDPAAVYAALALLALATLTADQATWLAAALPAATLLTATAVPLYRILFAPYANLAALWSAAPSPRVPASAAIAWLLATAAIALTKMSRRLLDTTAPILAVTTTLALAAAHVPWPVLPAAELLLGLAGLLRAALGRAFPTYGIFVLLAGAGLAGAVPTRPATIAALGLVLIAGVIAGAAGRRLLGWLAAVAAALGIAVLPAWTPTYPILAVAAATLGLSWLLRKRPAESRPVEAAAHAGAVFALLSANHLRTSAAVCVLWGVALGLRALRRDGRDAYLIAAATAELAGWTQLMLVAHVGTLEAYSIPAAAVALLAGVRIRHQRNESSWIAYGPALAAALIPSLASILFADGQHLRRLLLGLAALAILLAGARARLQAPVILAGGTLALVALHELALVWDLVPRWLPLAAAGLLLVLLATTLERRRRDFDRIRTALTRMT